MGTVVRKQNIFQRFLNSIVGVIIGVLLILGMFVLAIASETKENIAKVAKSAEEISIAQASSNTNELVVFSGNITTDGVIDDIALDDTSLFASLYSFVEVYAWVQHSSESSSTSLGGTETTTTVYTYAKEWTTVIETSFSSDTSGDTAKTTAVTENTAIKNSLAIPTNKLGGTTKNNSALKIGSVRLNSDIPLYGYTDLSSADLTDNLKTGYTVNNGYAYLGLGESLSLGDIRISYSAVKSGTSGTAIGYLKDNSGELTLSKYESKRGNSVYRFVSGLSSKSEMVDYLNAEHKASLWVLRIVVIIFMAIGFALITNPLSTLLSVIPFLGRLSEGLMMIVSIILGIVFGFIAILIGITFKYWFISLPILAIIVTLIVIAVKKKKANSPAQTNRR